jgi:flagellar L-ring protein precursor FlgH
MKVKFLPFLIIPIVFIGCAEKKQLTLDTKPKSQVIKQVEPIQKKKGTLYSRKGASLFSDKKDLQVGDIVQIHISETLTNDSTNDKKTTKSNSTGINGGLISPSPTTTAGTTTKIDRLNGLFGIGVNASSDNSFTGKVSSSIDEEFVTTISAIIEQTYQNGNYFIRGTKELLINGQKQTVEISGVIRPYDIEVDNTIKSEKLANLKILYNQEGDETDALEKPWGSRLIESISPF